VYPPLNVPKPVAQNVWIVDGPTIDFSAGPLKMPFPTRMTLVRLAGDRLFVHSPTLLTPELAAAVRACGTPVWIVAPNRLHYSWIAPWHESFNNTKVYLAPRVKEQAGPRIHFECLPLNQPTGYDWDTELATLPIAGSYLTEVTFFHYASRTLILTDLIENFEPDRVDSTEDALAHPPGRRATSRRENAPRHENDLPSEPSPIKNSDRTDDRLGPTANHPGSWALV
jgi:hypothetical protein